MFMTGPKPKGVVIYERVICTLTKYEAHAYGNPSIGVSLPKSEPNACSALY